MGGVCSHRGMHIYREIYVQICVVFIDSTAFGLKQIKKRGGRHRATMEGKAGGRGARGEKAKGNQKRKKKNHPTQIK